jgi:DNA-binding MarR family transcriptional regulator
MTVPETTEELLHRAIDRFWETIPPAWSRIRGHVRAIAAEHYGITVEQFHALRLIRKGVQSVSELAEVKQISRPAISQAVELLVEKGLVSRQKRAGDRRFVRLELTESGQAMLDAIHAETRAWMAEKLGALPPDDIGCLLRGMDVFKEAFEDADL